MENLKLFITCLYMNICMPHGLSNYFFECYSIINNVENHKCVCYGRNWGRVFGTGFIVLSRISDHKQVSETFLSSVLIVVITPPLSCIYGDTWKKLNFKHFCSFNFCDIMYMKVLNDDEPIIGIHGGWYSKCHK